MNVIKIIFILAIFPQIIQYYYCHLHFCGPFSSKFDILFLLDSTLAVENEENHTKMLEFVADFVEAIELGMGEDDRSRFAIAQFTPELRVEFNFNDWRAQIRKLKGMGEIGESSKLRDRILVRPFFF
jgi:hypothetical protein